MGERLPRPQKKGGAFKKWGRRALLAGALMGPGMTNADTPDPSGTPPEAGVLVEPPEAEDAGVPPEAGTPEPPEVNPNTRPDLMSMVDNAGHNLRTAIDKGQHGNLPPREGFEIADKYIDVASQLQADGADQLAAQVTELVVEVQRLAGEKASTEAQEIVESVPKTIHDIRVGNMTQQQCDKYIHDIVAKATFYNDHGLTTEYGNVMLAAERLTGAFNEMFGPQLPTGLYLDEWNGVHKRAASYGPDDLARDAGRIAVNVITGADRGLNEAVDTGGVVVTNGGQFLLDKVFSKSQGLEDRPEELQSDGSAYERRLERVRANQKQRAAELAAAATDEDRAAVAARMQLDVLTPLPSLTAGDRQAALAELQRTGQIMAGEIGVRFIMKGDKVKKDVQFIGETNQDMVDEYMGRAVAVLLARGENGDYRRIIAETSGLGGRELDALVLEVKNIATDLLVWMTFRDQMIEQGLDQTPQFEAVLKEIDKREKAITHKAGHIIWDDPKLGLPSAAQSIGGAFGTGRPQ